MNFTVDFLKEAILYHTGVNTHLNGSDTLGVMFFGNFSGGTEQRFYKAYFNGTVRGWSSENTSYCEMDAFSEKFQETLKTIYTGNTDKPKYLEVHEKYREFQFSEWLEKD